MSAHHAHLVPEDVLGFSLPRHAAEGLRREDARDVLSRLKKVESRWDLLGAHVAFEGKGYVRKRLYRDREWEMLLLCWLPGHTTVIHDHGGSWGATLVLSGAVHEWGFRWLGAGKRLELLKDRTLPASKTTVETPTTIHRVANASSEPAVSLHLYSPPLVALNSYDEKSGDRHRVDLEVSPSVAVGGAPQKRVAAKRSRR